jgi:hypothetical protein
MTVFVFGSNLAGRHGKGAALEAAQHHGAIRGVGWGRQGNSYAIPTKDFLMHRLPLPMIEYFCDVFVTYARNHPDEQFHLTPIGCGLAGYKAKQIAPFFDYCPKNIRLPLSFIY